jgi:hypothetical protein
LKASRVRERLQRRWAIPACFAAFPRRERHSPVPDAAAERWVRHCYSRDAVAAVAAVAVAAEHFENSVPKAQTP